MFWYFFQNPIKLLGLIWLANQIFVLSWYRIVQQVIFSGASCLDTWTIRFSCYCLLVWMIRFFFFQINFSGMLLSANLLKLESSILPRAKRASSETTQLQKNEAIFFLHWRLEIRSIERKTNFQIFIFRVMVIFVTSSPQFSMITRKINIGEFFYHISHKLPIIHKNRIKTEREGGGVWIS